MLETSPVGCARAALLEWVDTSGPDGRAFLQVQIRRTERAAYEVRHRADADRHREALRSYRDPRAALGIARTTQDGRHRPVRAAPDLRRGWTLVDLDPRGVWEALSLLYPAAALHWYQKRVGTLEVVSFDRSAARQTGRYAGVGQLQGARLERAVRACCGAGACLRRVEWLPELRTQDTGRSPPESAAEAWVPCREACSFFVSVAGALLEQENGSTHETKGIVR